MPKKKQRGENEDSKPISHFKPKRELNIDCCNFNVYTIHYTVYSCLCSYNEKEGKYPKGNCENKRAFFYFHLKFSFGKVFTIQ